MMRIARSLILFFFLIAGQLALAQNSIGVGDTTEAVLPESGTTEYRFIGEKGQYVTVSLDSDDFDAYVSLLDANNDQIAADDDSGEGFNAKIGPIRLEAGGVYTIVVTSLGESGAGGYTLSVASAAVRRIDYGQPITGELSEAEPATIFVFAAQAGEAISLEMESDDFDAYLSLDATNPRQNLIADDDSGVGYDARIAPFIIPESGEYSVTASRLYSGETGSYTLRLDHVNPQPLTMGTSQEIIMRNSQPLYYSFEGRVDQIVTIRVDSNNALDTTLYLVGPDSTTIAWDDDGGGFNDPAINDAVLNADGTYFITLQLDLDREIALPVTLSLTEGDVPSLDSGPQTIRLDDDDWDSHLLIFEGVANQVAIVRIHIDSDQPLSPNVTVSQRGDQFASLSTSSAMGEISLGFVVPQDGPVNVEITDYDYQAAELTVTLEKR